METPPDSSNGKPEPSVKEILAYPVLTPDEVAVLYRVSAETVMKMASDGELPAMRMKQHTRFLRVDVLRHMRDMRAGVRSQK
jgi:excisionase family DNA binding protein